MVVNTDSFKTPVYAFFIKFYSIIGEMAFFSPAY